MPLISVIIAVYNTGKYLCECLDSVLSQDYRNLEVIIIDDGSTDGSPDIIKRYAAADPRITVVTKKNGGLSSARNAGMRIAGGEYLCFVDSDDYLPLNALSLLEKSIASRSADIASGSFTVVSETGAPIVEHTVSAGKKWDWINHIACSRLYRRGFLLDNNLDFHENIWYEDVLFGTACTIKASLVEYIPDNVYFYRRRRGSIGMSTGEKVLDCLEVRRKLKRLLTENGLYESVFPYKHADLVCYHYYKRIDRQYRRALFEGMKKDFTPEDYRFTFKYGTKGEKLFAAALYFNMPGMFAFCHKLYRALTGRDE